MKAARAFGDEHDFAQLMPHLRQWGTTTVQRMMGTPSYFSHRQIRETYTKGYDFQTCGNASQN